MNCQRTTMDETKIYKVLGKISADVGEIKITQAVQTEQLKEHMRRNDLLEKRQDTHETSNAKAHDALASDMKPAADLAKQLRGALKFILLIGTIVSIVVGIMHIV